MAKANPFMEMIAKKKAEAAGKKPMKKMAMGGYADGGMPMKDGKPAFLKGKDKMAKGGMAAKKMASGGLAGGHKAADGIASKGKTKAKQIVMKKGGMCK